MKNPSCLIFIVFLSVVLLASAKHSLYIYPAYAVGATYILSDGSVIPQDAPVSTVDKSTYVLTGDTTEPIVVERSNIVIDGKGHIIKGAETGKAIRLDGISNVTIKNTNVENFTYGIYVESASFITVQENNITANSYDGIGQFYSSHITITKNNISSNGYDGIEIYNSSDITISKNWIAENKWYGLGIYFSSSNAIFANNFTNNLNGFELTYSEDSSIFHNNFLNHTRQVTLVSSVAVWDDGYPSGGNHWAGHPTTDDYGGPKQDQLGSDGICDTPYWIDSNNQDGYPLVSEYAFALATDINKDGKVNILDITIIGRAYGSSPEDQRWNTVCDLDRNNVINIIDLALVAKDFGKSI